MNTLDYLNQNSLRNYPIIDGAARVSDDGLFTIPNNLIVDLSLSSVGIGSQGLYVSSISANSSSVTIEVSVIGGTVFGSFYTALPNTNENFDLVMTPGTAYPDAAGLMTIGSTSGLVAQPSGEFSFASDSTKILTKCSSVANNGITRLTFTDATGSTYTFSGSVTVVANSNLQFTSSSSNTVLMNAGENLGLNAPCPSTSQPVLYINGVPPDNNGNFSLISDDSCISLSSIQYGLLISDSCNKPCLGCGDVSTLTTRVNTLESEIFAIQTFINNLNNTIAQANTIIGYQCQCEQ